MNAGHVVILILSVALAVASAVFSAIETAVFSLDEEHRRRFRTRHPTRANALTDILRRPEDTMHALILANTLTSLPLIVLVIYLLGELRPHFWEIGWGISLAAFGGVILVCELLPKLVALAAPVRTAALGVPIVRTIVPVLDPLCRRAQAASEWMVARLMASGMEPAPHLTDEELMTLVEIGQAEGTLGEAEAKLIAEVMKLSEESAKHCMTPRVDVFFLGDDLTAAEAADALRRKRYRRVPVRGETPDDVVGILDVRQFLLNSEVPYTDILQAPSYVPETMDALDLLWSFLHRRQHFAILLDEYGGIEGIVTLSDFIEELLGEEGPDSQTELYIETLSEGRIVAAGSARLDDLGDLLHWDVQDHDADSIGGFVVERLGSLPRPGTVISVDGWRITVRRATRKRIKEVLIEPIEDDEENAPDDEQPRLHQEESL